MTYDAETLLLEEMERDDLIEFHDFGTFKEVMENSMGIDNETGEIVDPDAGMLFPQPFRDFN